MYSFNMKFKYYSILVNQYSEEFTEYEVNKETTECNSVIYLQLNN